MTIKEAAAKYSLPASRIRTAIKRGLFKSEMKDRRRTFEQDAIEEAMKRSRVVERHDRTFVVRETRDLVVSDRKSEQFAANLGAEHCQEMLTKTGQQVLAI